jgi:hypothetical protein
MRRVDLAIVQVQTQDLLNTVELIDGGNNHTRFNLIDRIGCKQTQCIEIISTPSVLFASHTNLLFCFLGYVSESDIVCGDVRAHAYICV